MTKYQNTFRIESARLQEWDYLNPWWYYITINTKNHVEYFGDVANGKMILNELGHIVDEEWIKTKSLRPYVDLDYYVIMPNHFHGILIIDQNVETRRGESLLQQKTNTSQKNESISQFGKPIKNSLSVIINQFKGSVKRRANKNSYTDFSWQSRFYDRMIRNEKELFNIRKYIEQNPAKWSFDKDEIENMPEY
ncbi:MAG: transposase [Ignavibacteriales bacterium]|nr:transposase [Ignavibacteriales bacterium]